jgi:pimeloyl-ACP methyl ester carboxylesterase
MIGRMMALALGLALMGGSARAAMADVEGGQIYYDTCGQGPRTIVLLHDGVIDSASFDEVWPILCRDFRVVRYDRRGYGRSPAAKQPYSPQEDLHAVLVATKVEHATLVGFSNGGALALSYAIQHPEAVDRLILAGAAINGFEVSKAFIDRNTHIVMPMIVGNVDGVIERAAKDPYLLAPGHDAARDRAVAIAKASPQDIRHQAHDPIRPWTSDLPGMTGLKVPTLILVGDHDIADVQAMAGAAQVLIPGSKRVIVADSGHLMQLEHPKELAGLIAGFVEAGR